MDCRVAKRVRSFTKSISFSKFIVDKLQSEEFSVTFEEFLKRPENLNYNLKVIKFEEWKRVQNNESFIFLKEIE